METISRILLGLLGLSLIVLIHELGHFIAAKFCRVHVERLSLFLGRPLFSWKWGASEFAIGWLPLGGYCKMKDEGLVLQDFGNDFVDKESPKAQFEKQYKLQQNPEVQSISEPVVKDWLTDGKSFQEISALQKIFIILAGPLINILFALFVLFCFQLGGYPEMENSNRIIIPNNKQTSKDSPFPAGPSPAQKAGLQSGDTIIQLGGNTINNFADLRLTIALSADQNLELEYLRDGNIVQGQLKPIVNNEGRGWIGVLPWRDLVLQRPYNNGSVEILPGARLEKINGQSVHNWYELLEFLKGISQEESIQLQWSSTTGELLEQNSILAEVIRLKFLAKTWVRSPNFWHAMIASSNRLLDMFSMQLKGIVQLLSGRLQLQGNLAGPIQISDQIGQVMAGYGASFVERWYNSWLFLSFISFMIALANLLPLAVLDGGQILLYSIELISRKRLPKKWIMIYQAVGSFAVMGLMVIVLGFELIHYIF